MKSSMRLAPPGVRCSPHAGHAAATESSFTRVAQSMQTCRVVRAIVSHTHLAPQFRMQIGTIHTRLIIEIG